MKINPDNDTNMPLSAKAENNIRILQALRRIVRAIELHSKKLAANYQITTPQLVCLTKLREGGSNTASALSKLVHLSPSTLVGIIDRLEEKELAQRERDQKDRRYVNISITEKGKQLVAQAPSPLQDKLSSALDHLPELEHLSIALSLEKVVDLMEARDIEGEPVLKTGPMNQNSEEVDNTIKE